MPDLAEIIISGNILELKKFFRSSYNINTYVDQSLFLSTYYHEIIITKYILYNFSDRILDKTFNYILEMPPYNSSIYTVECVKFYMFIKLENIPIRNYKNLEYKTTLILS